MMKTRDMQYDLQQAEYMLEYDRRKMLDCADVFENLADVFRQMDEQEIFYKSEKEEENKVQEEILEDREMLWAGEMARENRKSFAGQMRQLAEILQEAASLSVRLVRLGGRQERQIIRAMAQEGLIVSDICFLCGNDEKMLLSVSAAAGKNKNITVDEIAGYLSVLLDMRLSPQKRNPYFLGPENTVLYFEQEASYEFMTGAATAVRETEKISGDSFSFWEQDNKVTLILSDGAGSGENASKDSSRIVELTEQILDTGMSEYMAVKMLNSMLRVQMQEDHFSTLDICSVDLKNACVRLVKAGGIKSFIRHRGFVEQVGEHTLPLGLIGEEQIEMHERFLESGDMVILLSDGILHDWNDGDCMTQLQEVIMQSEVFTPQELANRILRCAITQSHGNIRDDMTVMVLGIWKK